ESLPEVSPDELPPDESLPGVSPVELLPPPEEEPDEGEPDPGSPVPHAYASGAPSRTIEPASSIAMASIPWCLIGSPRPGLESDPHRRPYDSGHPRYTETSGYGTRRLNGNQSRDRRRRAGDKGRECPTCSVGVALARRSRSADRAPQRRRVRWPFTSPWFEPQPRWGQPLDTTVAGR